MEEREIDAMVEIVVRAGRPLTSNDVAKEYERDTGKKLNQTSSYRRLIKAAGQGRVRQDERRRWVPGAPDRAAGPAPTPARTATPAQVKDKARTAAGLYEKVAELLKKDPPELSDAMLYKRSADQLLAGV